MGVLKSPSDAARDRPLVYMVHEFGGSPRSLRRHQKLFAEELGFDTFVVSLEEPKPLLPQLPSWTGLLRNSFESTWIKQITKDLESFGDRSIILFSLSFPSGIAIKALAPYASSQLKAWICDGGPFFKLPLCMWNYMTHQDKSRNLLTKSAKTLLALLALDFLRFEKSVTEAIATLPQHFPVLSIRYWQDKLVPIAAIDAVFAHHTHLDFETLAFPEAAHLAGLVNEKDQYTKRLSEFLRKLDIPKN